MSLSNTSISEQWHRAADTWADAEAAADLLENTKSAVLSEMMLQHSDVPLNRAEMLVKSSERWKDHVRKISDARHAANKAKVQMDYLRMRFWESQSADATHRLESRL